LLCKGLRNWARWPDVVGQIVLAAAIPRQHVNERPGVSLSYRCSFTYCGVMPRKAHCKPKMPKVKYMLKPTKHHSLSHLKCVKNNNKMDSEH
jgi:hypothetical protein